METAETIATKGGNKVTLVEMTKDIGRGLYRSVIADFTIRFSKLGIDVLTRSQFMSADSDGVVVMNTVNRQMKKIPAQTVVLALGVRSNDVSAQFEEAFDNVIVLGDANFPGRIAEATTDALGRASTL
jgi:NADH dehydrogenase FAD-containing subunit